MPLTLACPLTQKLHAQAWERRRELHLSLARAVRAKQADAEEAAALRAAPRINARSRRLAGEIQECLREHRRVSHECKERKSTQQD